MCMEDKARQAREELRDERGNESPDENSNPSCVASPRNTFLSQKIFKTTFKNAMYLGRFRVTPTPKTKARILETCFSAVYVPTKVAATTREMGPTLRGNFTCKTFRFLHFSLTAQRATRPPHFWLFSACVRKNAV